jgi:hypothetical protein
VRNNTKCKQSTVFCVIIFLLPCSATHRNEEKRNKRMTLNSNVWNFFLPHEREFRWASARLHMYSSHIASNYLLCVYVSTAVHTILANGLFMKFKRRPPVGTMCVMAKSSRKSIRERDKMILIKSPLNLNNKMSCLTSFYISFYVWNFITIMIRAHLTIHSISWFLHSWLVYFSTHVG